MLVVGAAVGDPAPASLVVAEHRLGLPPEHGENARKQQQNGDSKGYVRNRELSHRSQAGQLYW